MTDDSRPDPDKVLRAIHAEEESAKRGALRVFLGMAPGVGKTYAMLEAGQARQKEGVDVVIGVVETHGRAETLALTQGLPAIPKRRIQYKGVDLWEMDLDAILARKPKIVLVDELAHSNAPGSRHPKRHHDVVELLDNGIDVYTTVNVQHLESRKDLVEKISSVPVRETVPDSILEMAKQIEVIDITPADLLKRLGEGKVYLGDRADRAAANFFRPDTLTALRELALRFTAEKVDQELQGILETKVLAGPWQTNERLMVAVSHSPYSERVIRATRRLAYNLEAPWIAVHIDSGVDLTDADQNQLAKNLALARDLRAEVITTSDPDIPSALRRIARQKNVTQIVVGRPTRRWIRDIVEGGTLLDRLVGESWEVDVHVIRQDDVPKFRRRLIPRLSFERGFLPYWNTLILYFGIAFIGGMVEPMIGYRAVGFLFLLGVLAVGRLATLGPTVFAAFLSAITWNFFFTQPRLTFNIGSPEDFMMFLSNFVVALITGTMTNRMRVHERLIRDREERTNVLYEVLNDISVSREKDEFLDKVCLRMNGVLAGECGVVLANDGKLATALDKRHRVHLGEKEFAVAQWSFDNRKMAGWGTDTLAQARSLYIPLEASHEAVGVFVYTPDSHRKLSVEQENLLYSVCRQLAVAIERRMTERRVREAERLAASEKLHQTLLNSISHEMRTPLTTLMGAASAIADGRILDSEDRRRALVAEIQQASDRLNRVVENLLDMSRLNAGVMAVDLQWHDLNDVVGVALARLRPLLAGHNVEVAIPESLPLIKIDYRLFEHALTNILHNAALYTPPGSEIKLDASVINGRLWIAVEDTGPGIPAEHVGKVFDKFFRVPGVPAGGTGLGLSIAKGIVEVHGGEIFVERSSKGGSRFVIILPILEPPSPPSEYP